MPRSQTCVPPQIISENMARIIKFRAWDVQTKKMLVPPVIDNPEQSDSGWVLMQFTGLKDKKGVEIYEGDILYGGLRSGDVFWEPMAAQWWINTEGTWPNIELHKNNQSAEIIGNIYESPAQNITIKE